MDINNHIKPTIEQDESCEQKGMPNCPKKICDCITFAQSYTCEKLYGSLREKEVEQMKFKKEDILFFLWSTIFVLGVTTIVSIMILLIMNYAK